MATVTAHGDMTDETATFDAFDAGAVPLPRRADRRVQLAQSSCCRCRQPIEQGAIAEAPQTWTTATEADPWCQGGAHLPKAVHVVS